MTAAPLALLVSGSVVVAATGRLPRPEGWIGTTEQWTRGLGLVLCVLALVVLVLAWRHLARGGSVRTILGMLFFGLLVLPIIIIFFGYAKGLEGMETERACGGCHVMTGHVNDLRQPDSESLAAVHFKNRYIRETPCYTCHSDYGMFGVLSAKMDGVRHVVHYVARTYTLPLKIAEPYSNLRCLECHADSQKFLKSEGHPAEIGPDLVSGKTSCLECHGPAHTPAEARR